MLNAIEPLPNQAQKTEQEAQEVESIEHSKTQFHWQDLIPYISVLITCIIIVMMIYRVKRNQSENVSTNLVAPTIQKITPEFVSFVKNNNAQYDFKTENKIFQAQFGVEAQKPSVSFGVDEEKGIIFSYQSDNNNTPSINTDGEKLVYKEVEKNIDLQYQALPNGIKEEIILNQARPQTENSNVFTFVSNFQGAFAKTKQDGSLEPIFYDSKGNYLFHFEKPFAIDAAGNRTDDVTFKIERQEGGDYPTYYMHLSVDAKWLNSSDRVYPIVIDPTVLRTMATGGTVTYVGDDTIHTFTTSGTLVVNGPITVKVLVVGGGGNGGPGANDCLGGGGGGGGGLIYNTSFAVAAGSYSVTVGNAGSNSVFSTLTAIGGGSGGVTGGNGGSGGGSMGSNQSAGSGTVGQGNNGGVGYGTYGSTCTAGGGGGGASSVGGNGTGYTAPGGGGTGTSVDISGAAVTYAVGGTGGVSTGGISGAAGGANTGNGGGGGAGGSIGVSDPYGYGGGGTGGSGGTGIVIIRYTNQYADVNPPAACHVQESSDDSQIEVTWTDSSTDEEYYEVQRNTDDAGWNILSSSISANTTSFIDDTISSDHTYQYRVAPYVGSTYAPWCTTAKLDLGVGDLNFGGLDMDGILFN